MLLLRRPPTLETPHCPISFKFLAEVLSDCKYLWRTMQLLDQGFTCLLFFFHMPSVYPVHLSLFALLELFLLFGARIMLLFMLTQPQSSGHFVPLAGSSPDREHQGKTHGPTHNSVTRVLWVVSYGRTSSFSGNSSQPTVNVIVVGAPSWHTHGYIKVFSDLRESGAEFRLYWLLLSSMWVYPLSITFCWGKKELEILIHLFC